MAEKDPENMELDEDDDDMMDMPSLENFLVTEDGDNIADGLVKSLNRIADRIDTQNKILVKILSAVSS